MKNQKFSHKTPHLKGKQHQLDPNLDLKQLVHHASVEFVDRDADGDVDVYDNPKKKTPDENPIDINFGALSKKLIAKEKGELKHSKQRVAYYEDLRRWFGKGEEGGVGGGGWDEYNTKGERTGKCARGENDDGDGPKPKCLSKEKAAKMSKSEIAAAVRRKRKEDPVADRPGKGGKPKMVSNKIQEQSDEERYCPMCRKRERRMECSYGPAMWDAVTVGGIKESKKPEPDHEHSMARSELATIEKAVKRLKSKMKGEGNIEAWVQSKITKAADYIDSAADYLDSGEHDVQGSMDEEKDPCGYKQEGMKKKGNKMVPNCVPVSEASFEISHTSSDAKKARRAKKIDALSQRGTGGEQQTAAKMVGVSLPPIRKEEISIVDKILLEMEAEVLTEKNKPTNPKLWAKWKSKAKAKFDVYPCVPLESQAITREGLKFYHELNIGEDILTYNIDNDVLEWKPILHLNFYEQAPLKRIYKKSGFSIRATENHKWVVRSGNEYQNVNLVETKDIHKRMRLVTCSELHNDSNINLFEQHWSKKDNWVEKVLSWNKDQREIYLASSIVYDGWDQGGSTKIKERHTFGFTQKNDDHFWATLLSAYLNGYHVSFYEKTDTISGATIVRNKKYHSTQNLIIEDDSIEDVWCPTTENNTWVMVQNGFITITGNSAYANGWAAKGYKSEGGGWESVKEEKNILCEVCGKSPCECSPKRPMGGSSAKPGPDKNYVKPMGESVRIPAKTGNIILVTLTWRGKYYTMKLFFPQTTKPNRQEVQDQISKVYPGSRVQSFYVSDIKPGEQFLQVEDWQKVNRQDKTDGLSQKAVDAYRRENPGSKLQTAVTEKNPKGKRADRRKAFCRRSAGQRDMYNIDCSKTPDKPICKARRRWKC